MSGWRVTCTMVLSAERRYWPKMLVLLPIIGCWTNIFDHPLGDNVCSVSDCCKCSVNVTVPSFLECTMMPIIYRNISCWSWDLRNDVPRLKSKVGCC